MSACVHCPRSGSAAAAFVALLAGCPTVDHSGLPGYGDDDTTEAPSCDDPSDLVTDPDYFHIVYPGEIGPIHPHPVLPSDRYLVETEDGRLMADWPDVLLPGSLEHTDGFPTFLPILLPFSGPVDGATVTEDRFRLFAVDGETAEPFVPLRVQLNEEEELAYLVPLVALPEGARIGVAVLSGILSAGGEPLESPAHYRCLVEGWDEPDAALLREGVVAAHGWLSDQGIAATEVVYVNTFRTGTPQARLAAAGGAIDLAAAAGSLTGAFDTVLDAIDEGGYLVDEVKQRLPTDYQPGGVFPDLRTFVHGTVTLPDVGPLLDDPAAATGAGEDVPFTLLLPPLIEGGEVPVVIYLHGIASCREHLLALAPLLTGAGYAVASIDARAHYVRNDPEITTCFNDHDAMAFIDMTDVAGTDRRFALSALDVLGFQRFVERALPDLLDSLAAAQGLSTAPGVGAFHLVGHSLGGMLGTLTSSTLSDDDVAAGGRFVASASGGGLLAIAMPMLEPGLLRDPLSGDALRLFIEGATAMALGDPLSHAGGIRGDVLVQIARDDETMPPATTEMLALVAGLPLLEPVAWEVADLAVQPTPAQANLEDGRTGGLFEYAPASHSFLFSSVAEDPELAGRAQSQLLRFLDDGVIHDAYEEP
jgi:pimeloyl-ACP methyl ester carboxylesterase